MLYSALLPLVVFHLALVSPGIFIAPVSDLCYFLFAVFYTVFLLLLLVLVHRWGKKIHLVFCKVASCAPALT